MNLTKVLSQSISRNELEKEYAHYSKLKSHFLVRDYLFRKLNGEVGLEKELESIAGRMYNSQVVRFKAFGLESLNATQLEVKKKFCLPENINKIINCSDGVAIEFYNFCKKLEAGFLDNYRSYGVEEIEKKIKNNDKSKDGLHRLNATLLCKIFNSSGCDNLIGFSNWQKNDFVSWFIKEARKGTCSYCHRSIDELLSFYSIVNPKSGRGLSWEIDRRKPAGNYAPVNCALTCYYCNSAKSDVFDDEQFVLIGQAIGREIRKVVSRTSEVGN